MTVTGTRITRNIRSAFLGATLSQDIAYFDKGKGGSVATHVTTNGNTIQTGIAEKLGLTFQAMSACVASIIIALISQWKLTLITITVAPVIVGVIGIAVSLDAKVETAMLKAFDEAGALAEDILASIRNVSAFWMRPRLLEKYDKCLEKVCIQLPDLLWKIRSLEAPGESAVRIPLGLIHGAVHFLSISSSTSILRLRLH